MALTRGMGALVVVLVAGGMGGACAASVDPGGDGGAGPSSSNASSGSGAGGATTGSGGDGGESTSLCGMDCTAIAAPDCYHAVCNEGAYPGTVGQCVVVPVDDGTACDDGQFCTTGDTCQAGTCTGGPQNDCGMTPPECTEIQCNESTDSCSTTPIPNGGPCTPSDLCLVGATCVNGLCAGGTQNDCFFQPVPDECHVSQCNPMNGMCEPVVGNEGGACTDLSDLCTVNKTCMSGVCQGGQPMNCSQLTQGCVLGVCDTNTGQCTTQAVGEGMLCDDLDPCTTGETCTMGNCTNGTAVTTCMDGDGCCPSNCNDTNDLECAIPMGTAALTTGGTVPVMYLPCGSGTPGSCTAQTAKNTCTAMGRKVVSHASDGTTEVLSLNATTSCNWSVSYYTVNQIMPPGSCLVGVSNLEWSSCCTTTQWHGNTIDFPGVVNQIFGYVATSNSGYVSTNPNVSGATWGCIAETGAATNITGCTTQYVACAL
ncbi:MAG: hypothetical protein R3B72_51815 [Polyangiaceae bacterium]